MNIAETWIRIYDEIAQVLVFVPRGEPAPVLSSSSRRVFVCGGLQNPVKMASVLGRARPFVPCAVTGFVRSVQNVDGAAVPFMQPDNSDPAPVMTGVAWLELSEEDARAIERFELAGGLRTAIDLVVTAGKETLRAVSYIRS